MRKKQVQTHTTIPWILGGIGILLSGHIAYIGWRYNFGPLKRLGKARLVRLPGNAEAYSFSHIKPMENSPLQGRTVLFLGSSVTNGKAALEQSIPEYFVARMGCKAIKEAVDGTTLTDCGNTSYIQRLLHNVRTDEPVDLLVCQLSTNDASQRKPLGVIAPNTELDKFDTITVTGAMEYIIAYAKEIWDCPVVFYTNARYDSKEYAAMVLRTYELAHKWGIGVLDLWSDDGFNALSEAERTLYMQDHIHPVKAGYRNWWGPELERQLCEFLSKR